MNSVSVYIHYAVSDCM